MVVGVGVIVNNVFKVLIVVINGCLWFNVVIVMGLLGWLLSVKFIVLVFVG